MILAIDPATKTGYATTLGEIGTLDLTNEPNKLTALRGLILRMHAAEPITVIAYEHAAMGSFKNKGGRTNHATIEFHGKLRGVIEQTAEEIGAKLLPVNPMTLKKFATGRGRAKKPDMIRAAEKQFGLRNLTGDEADARFALEYAIQAERRPAEFRTAKQRKKIAKKAAKDNLRLW